MDTGLLAVVFVDSEQLLKQWQGRTNIFTDLVYVVAPLRVVNGLGLGRGWVRVGLT